MLDLTAYEDFISESKITRGIIVADKGFPSNMIKNYLKNNPDLHYLNLNPLNKLLCDFSFFSIFHQHIINNCISYKIFIVIIKGDISFNSKHT